MAGGIVRQAGAKHIDSAAQHGGAGDDIFRHGVFKEAFGRDDLHLAGRHIGRVHHAQHAAEMIDMAVGVDDRDHRPLAQFVSDQRHCGLGGFGTGERINDDPAGGTADHGHVGQIKPAHLPDAIGHLEQAVFRHQRRIAPQAGVHRRRCRAGKLGPIGQIAQHVALGIADLAVGDGAEKAAAGEIEILFVGPIERCCQRGIIGLRLWAGGWRCLRGGGGEKKGDEVRCHGFRLGP